MGKKERDKGCRTEREIVNIFRRHGITAQRIPLSGGTDYAKGDIEAVIKGRKMRIEVKARKDGFKQIYDWKGEFDALIIKRDRSRPLIVLDIEDLCRLVGGGADGDN